MKRKANKKKSWKVGDWGFCEFKLQTILEMEKKVITSVSDGWVRMSSGGTGFNDRFFPIEMEIKLISDTVKYWSNKFHKEGSKKLNFPDLNRLLIKLWIDAIKVKDDARKLQKAYEEIDEFGELVMRLSNDAKLVSAGGSKPYKATINKMYVFNQRMCK